MVDDSRIVLKELNEKGFYLRQTLFSERSINQLKQLIVFKNGKTFAVRQFFKVYPQAKKIIFNTAFQDFFTQNIGKKYHLIKAIYFDKPPTANWIVPWHQDLTIVTEQKADIKGYSKWRLKNGMFYTQPPLELLEDIITIRIHLDRCTFENGALRVIPKSHQNGVCSKLVFSKQKPFICEVEAGGIMLMKPLLFHASKRTSNNLNRRVVHLEFSSKILPKPLSFGEKLIFTKS